MKSVKAQLIGRCYVARGFHPRVDHAKKILSTVSGRAQSDVPPAVVKRSLWSIVLMVA